MNFEVPLILVTACVAAGLLWPDRREFLYLALILGILSAILPVFRKYLSVAWFRFAELLGMISSRVILGVFFFLILVPLAFLFRIFHKDPLNLRNGKTSVYHERFHTYIPDDLNHPW